MTLRQSLGDVNPLRERLEEVLDVAEEMGTSRFEVLQSRYNLLERAPYEDGLRAVCERHELAYVPYWTLAKGFLTGKYRSRELVGGFFSERATFHDVGGLVDERSLAILAALDEIAASHETTVAAMRRGQNHASEKKPTAMVSTCQRPTPPTSHQETARVCRTVPRERIRSVRTSWPMRTEGIATTSTQASAQPPASDTIHPMISHRGRMTALGRSQKKNPRRRGILRCYAAGQPQRPPSADHSLSRSGRRRRVRSTC